MNKIDLCICRRSSINRSVCSWNRFPQEPLLLLLHCSIAPGTGPSSSQLVLPSDWMNVWQLLYTKRYYHRGCLAILYCIDLCQFINHVHSHCTSAQCNGCCCWCHSWPAVCPLNKLIAGYRRKFIIKSSLTTRLAGFRLNEDEEEEAPGNGATNEGLQMIPRQSINIDYAIEIDSQTVSLGKGLL